MTIMRISQIHATLLAALSFFLGLPLLWMLGVLSGPGAGFVGVLGLFVLGVANVLSGIASSAPTEVKRDEAAIVGETRLAEALIEPVVIINQDRRVQYANPAARDVLGIDATGEQLSTYLRQPNILAAVDKALAGKNPKDVEFDILSPVERNMSVVATPMESAFGNGSSRALIVMYERTETVRANVLRGDFVANASHELRTPVASMLGYIETLQGHAKDDPEARDKFLDIMHAQAERMQRLISDLLSLSHIQQSEHIPPDDVVNLSTIVRNAIEAVAPFADANRVALNIDIPRKALVVGSHDQLVQVCLNLVDNAIKAMPNGGHVNISLESGQSVQVNGNFADIPVGANSTRFGVISANMDVPAYTVLRIRDNGPGFEKKHLPRLGERFYRISDDRAPKRRGTGLGLAIIKHIIMRHRGGLLIESEAGTGTEFTILIPEPDTM